MKVTTYKTIETEVEVEVDVDLEDVIQEFAEDVDRGVNGQRRLLAAVDTLTRILARVSDASIADMTAEQREIVSHRLEKERKRYAKEKS